jgi:hypothetical protein
VVIAHFAKGLAAAHTETGVRRGTSAAAVENSPSDASRGSRETDRELDRGLPRVQFTGPIHGISDSEHAWAHLAILPRDGNNHTGGTQ